ncbi:DNA polymerase III subunit gamma/tau [Bacillus horti]|uniref:DNA polymerase III subunit gamma/tau n=1 Tax=Caldalkalibacillus horti TaxID=77523 RepID=A0ABT9W044_9BACI|nr:DNA polymerase III subunit gamma/tau [Bacillus horti]MDQ0166608.1 hypothetical protein [Bacillus horti]
MNKRDMVLPQNGVNPNEVAKEEIVESKETDLSPKEEISPEEASFREKVFFEEDESVRLRDGISYKIPPLGIKAAKELMKKLNSVDTAIIIANMIENEAGDTNYNDLLEVLLMGFKPYYPKMTTDYLEEYIDIVTAKEIIDILIGLNGLKKSL